MRVISSDQLKSVLANLPENPRIIASGNFATPNTLLAIANESIAEFRLHMLNAQPGIPDREGITYESAFVGPGMRRSPRLMLIVNTIASSVRLLLAAGCARRECYLWSQCVTGQMVVDHG